MTIVNHECYVSLEVANLLIKAGFDWRDYFVAHSIDEHFHWEIPLHIAQRWLREVKNISVDVLHQHNGWVFGITDLSNDSSLTVKLITSSTYEEALEAGIKKTLELILKK